MHTFTDSPSRDDIAAALASGSITFIDCMLDDADLSRLDLRGSSFINCSIAETSFYAAKLAQTTWQRCRGRQADFEAADLTDAQFQSCDLNNSSWRRSGDWAPTARRRRARN
ncbi:MAG: hypothetical protein EOO80_20180, partial [Oxalobacteraceae bacterium]